MEEYKHMEEETKIDVILMLSRESRIGVNILTQMKLRLQMHLPTTHF
jgi:hypothetical protein